MNTFTYIIKYMRSVDKSINTEQMYASEMHNFLFLLTQIIVTLTALKGVDKIDKYYVDSPVN